MNKQLTQKQNLDELMRQTLLNNLMPNKTFTIDDLVNIKKLGYEIESVGSKINGI